MIPNKGRYIDCNPINQPPGTWRQGKNFVVNKKKAAFVTEPGTDLTATEFPFEIARPIGSGVFPDGSYVQFADGINGGKDRIGVVDINGVYTDKIVDDALNFDAAFPIRSYEMDYNYATQRIIGFTDRYNSFRVLNVDDIPFDQNPDLSLVNPGDISDLEGFPKFKLPIFTFTVNQAGGAIYSGAYSACFAYESYDGTRTPASPPSKMIYITEDSTAIGYDKFDGCPPRTRTAKSITFTVTNVDTRYDILVLIIVRKMGGVTEVAQIKKVDVTGSTTSITYVGSETESIMSAEEVLTPRPLYNKVGCIAQLNSQLYLGDLEAEFDIEYQEYANNIKVQYNTKLITVSNIDQSHKNVLPGGFAHGGVYALYIAFVLKNGSWSRAFHIPGRPAIPAGTSNVPTNIVRSLSIEIPQDEMTYDPSMYSEAVLDNSSGYFNSSITIYGSTSYNGPHSVVFAQAGRVVFFQTHTGVESGFANELATVTVTTIGDKSDSSLAGPAVSGIPLGTKIYQIEDTTNKPQPPYSFIGDTLHVTNLNGPTNMGYWENQNEVYPKDFPGGLQGHPVRHHVFPTIRKCKEIHWNSDPGYGRQQLDVLGIDVANVVIPEEIKDRIEGWAIFYANRDYSNSNTLGTDLYLVSHASEQDVAMLWSAGGNWRTRNYHGHSGDFGGYYPNLVITNDSKKYLRGHNFELQKDMPSLSASGLFIDFELKIRKFNLGAWYEDVNKAGGAIAGSGEGWGQNPGAVIDLTDTVNCAATVVSPPLLRQVEEYKYLPANIIDGNIRTMKTEDIISMKIYNGESIPLDQSEVHVNGPAKKPANVLHTIQGEGSSFPPNGGEETYLISYKQVKTNVYDEFDNQLLTLTDTLCLPSDTYMRGIRGGDSFTSVRTFICNAPRYATDLDLKGGITIIRAHVSESRHNIGLRHETIGEVTTKYYPKTQPNEFWNNPGEPNTDSTQMIWERNVNPNGLAYNIDYNATNTYVQLATYTANQRLTNKFPYRVIRGGSNAGARADVNGWKTFLAADYYESNRNRGKITDLFVLDDNLFIHHKFGLFRTLGSEKLSLGSTEVYLGTADIFAQRPKELVTTEIGFLGNQNIFAGFTFEGGRFWVDQSRGKCFLLNKQGASEISKDGLYEFFRDNLRIPVGDLDPENHNYPYHDSPIIGQGIIANYDPKYERLILTKKSDINPFTLSYSLEKEQNYWAFDHSYIPDYLFGTSTDLYGYKNNRIHKFNSSIKVARYFEGDPQRSEIELIFNEQNNRNKEFFNFHWISEVLNEAGGLEKNKTLTHIRVRTSYQDSGEISLIPFTTFSARYTTRRFKNTWNFNKVKDANPDVFKRKGMVDNYVSVTFIFDNALNLDNTQNSLYLYLLNAKAILAEL